MARWLGNAINSAASRLAELGVDDDEADFGLDLDAVRDEPMADQAANQPAGRPPSVLQLRPPPRSSTQTAVFARVPSPGHRHWCRRPTTSTPPPPTTMHRKPT